MYAIPHQTLRMHTDGEVPRLNFSAGTNRYTRAGRDRHLVFRSLAFAVCGSRMPPHVGQGMHSLCTLLCNCSIHPTSALYGMVGTSVSAIQYGYAN